MSRPRLWISIIWGKNRASWLQTSVPLSCCQISPTKRERCDAEGKPLGLQPCCLLVVLYLHKLWLCAPYSRHHDGGRPGTTLTATACKVLGCLHCGKSSHQSIQLFRNGPPSASAPSAFFALLQFLHCWPPLQELCSGQLVPAGVAAAAPVAQPWPLHPRAHLLQRQTPRLTCLQPVPAGSCGVSNCSASNFGAGASALPILARTHLRLECCLLLSCLQTVPASN